MGPPLCLPRGATESLDIAGGRPGGRDGRARRGGPGRLDDGDRHLPALWWHEAAGDLTRTELATALGIGQPHAAVRLQRMRAQLETARAIVRALAESPRCDGLATVVEGWNGVAGRCGASGCPGTSATAPAAAATGAGSSRRSGCCTGSARSPCRPCSRRRRCPVRPCSAPCSSCSSTRPPRSRPWPWRPAAASRTPCTRRRPSTRRPPCPHRSHPPRPRTSCATTPPGTTSTTASPTAATARPCSSPTTPPSATAPPASP